MVLATAPIERGWSAPAGDDPETLAAAVKRFSQDIRDKSKLGQPNVFVSVADTKNQVLWNMFLAAYELRTRRATVETGKSAFEKYLALYPAKTETQVGSTASNSGTTALALKGGAAQIFSFAVENGGLTKEQTGTTVTFRGKPVGLVKAFQKYDFFQILDGIEKSGTAKFWDKFSFAASFDANRGGVTNTLLANDKQLTNWSVRYEIINQRSAAHRAYAADWMKVNRSLGLELLVSNSALLKAVEETPGFIAWHDGLLSKAKALDLDSRALDVRIADFEAHFLAAAAKLAIPIDKLSLALSPALATWTALQEQSAPIEAKAKRGKLATLDFSTKRDDALPDLYTGTFVFETAGWRNGANDLTINVGASAYRVEPKAPSKFNQFKSFDAVLQYDIPLGEIQTFGKAILTFAAKFQYVGTSVTRAGALMADVAPPPVAGTAPAVLNLRGLIPTVEGPLGVFQAKISFPIKGGGVKIPLAFTAATRSEVLQNNAALQNKNDYRAHIGLTFDLDTLFAKESAKK